MKITDEHRKRMHELSGQGLTWRAIAREIGCNNSTVGNVLNPAYRERHRVSCGTWRDDNPEQYANGVRLSQAKLRAESNGVPFDATFFDEIGDWPANCPVCHVKMERGDGKIQTNSPSIDRIIPELGYVPGNVQWLCQGCNTSKNDRPMSYLLERRSAA